MKEIIELVLNATSILAIAAVVIIVLMWVIHIFKNDGK